MDRACGRARPRCVDADESGSPKAPMRRALPSATQRAGSTRPQAVSAKRPVRPGAGGMPGEAVKVGSSAAASGRDMMDFCRDQPLVVVGLGLAVGAAVGAMLPRTRAEDQFMGDLSDQLKQQTKEFAGEQLDKAKTVGERAYDAAQHEAERQGLSVEAAANEAASRIEDTSI